MKDKKDVRDKIKQQSRIILILALFLLVAVTSGVSYAFFNYMKPSSTENVITTSQVRFLYDEKSALGNGISIIDALPTSDTDGKRLIGSNNVFDFKIVATSGNISVPYEITARKKNGSDDIDQAIKLYLTEVTNKEEKDTPLTIKDNVIKHYSELSQTSILVTEGTVEKTLYIDDVEANTKNYEKNFRLRMWLADDVSFSPTKDENGNDIYPMNQKKFSVTINVYSPSPVITS